MKLYSFMQKLFLKFYIFCKICCSSLTEKIVAMLPKMNCPYRIEPHQIQGLDCIHIFPVIQWLVKRSMEMRQEMAGFVRGFALNQFYKKHSFSENFEIEATINKVVIRNLHLVKV